MSKSLKLVLFAFLLTTGLQAFAIADGGEIMANQEQEQPARSAAPAIDKTDKADLIVEELPDDFLNSQEEAFLDAHGFLPVQTSNPYAIASNGNAKLSSKVHRARIHRSRGCYSDGEGLNGCASVYSDGSKTCSQRYKGGLTVAHKSLPCGTFLRFTYGGRSVVAMVNDRGPFIKGRKWDLNAPTARALGISGVEKVTAEIVPKPAN